MSPGPASGGLALCPISRADASQRVLSRARSYGELTETGADGVIAALPPIRERHHTLLRDPAELRRQLDRGASRARDVADGVLQRARAAIGIV